MGIVSDYLGFSDPVASSFDIIADPFPELVGSQTGKGSAIISKELATGSEKPR